MKKSLPQKERKRLSLFLLILFLGGVAGGIFTEILGLVLEESTFSKILTWGLSLNKSLTLNLAIISITLSKIKITLFSIGGMILAGWLYLKI